MKPEVFAQRLQERYGTAVIVIGLGAEGALLAVSEDGNVERLPAVRTRASRQYYWRGRRAFFKFQSLFQHSRDPYAALRKAVVFASYKIGETGAAEGFLSAVELGELMPASEHNG